ncbi:hypothetical protein LDG_5020 [Legionella drancourtii LLAP12]|uniref:Uncharacterized protein n=1 Tax=Legionella drancourtii LLAP12 TaxID=658187 RepID=G9EIL5_9GAMM|nr:hypothetical protein LDG_5020 [Legionella drancourtii LLAP12]
MIKIERKILRFASRTHLGFGLFASAAYKNKPTASENSFDFFGNLAPR